MGSQEYFRSCLWSSTIFLFYATLILIYDALYSFRLYYIQFKEVKILRGPEAEGRIWRSGAGGPDNTKTPFLELKFIICYVERLWSRQIISYFGFIYLIKHKIGTL